MRRCTLQHAALLRLRTRNSDKLYTYYVLHVYDENWKGLAHRFTEIQRSILFREKLDYVFLIFCTVKDSLPENQPLLRVAVFAESKNTGSRQTRRLRSAPLGKEGPSANERLAVSQNLDKQKCSANWAILARGSLGKERRTANWTFVVSWALGKRQF